MACIFVIPTISMLLGFSLDIGLPMGFTRTAYNVRYDRMRL